MFVLYLSDGEQHAVLSIGEVFANLRASFENEKEENVEAIIEDIEGALDASGFWHGWLGVYNVVIIHVKLIYDLFPVMLTDSEIAIKQQKAVQ